MEWSLSLRGQKDNAGSVFIALVGCGLRSEWDMDMRRLIGIGLAFRQDVGRRRSNVVDGDVCTMVCADTFWGEKTLYER